MKPPPVITGPGGAYRRGYTPTLAPQRRFDWSIVIPGWLFAFAIAAIMVAYFAGVGR